MRPYTPTIAAIAALTAGILSCQPASIADAPQATTTIVPAPTTTIAAAAVNARSRMEIGVTVPTTIAPLPFDPVCGEPLMRLAIQVGWPADQLPMLDRVARKESGGDCHQTDTNPSHNAADPMGGSYGTMQINGFWCTRTTYNRHDAGWLGERGILTSCADLHNTTINLRAALLIWQRGGWSAWGF
jgi:hypothetical protein